MATLKNKSYMISDIEPYTTDSGMVRPELVLVDMMSAEVKIISGNNYNYLIQENIGIGTKLIFNKKMALSDLIKIESSKSVKLVHIPITCPSCKSMLVKRVDVWCCVNLACSAIRLGNYNRLQKVLGIKHLFDAKRIRSQIITDPAFNPIDLINPINLTTIKQFLKKDVLKDLTDDRIIRRLKYYVSQAIIPINLLQILTINISQTYAEMLAPYVDLDTILNLKYGAIVCAGVPHKKATEISTLISSEINIEIVTSLKSIVKNII